jgi:hypothetical protein
MMIVNRDNAFFKNCRAVFLIGQHSQFWYTLTQYNRDICHYSSSQFFVLTLNWYPVTHSPSQWLAPFLLQPEFVPVLAQLGSQATAKQCKKWQLIEIRYKAHETSFSEKIMSLCLALYARNSWAVLWLFFSQIQETCTRPRVARWQKFMLSQLIICVTEAMIRLSQFHVLLQL